MEAAALAGENLEGASFRGNHHLQGLTLRSVKLVEADFSDAVLSEARLVDCDLWRSRLHGAELVRSEFRDSMLLEAQFQGANLERASFHGAILRRTVFQGAVLRGARLARAVIDEADFTGAFWDKGFRVPEETEMDFSGAQALYQKLKQEHQRVGGDRRAGEFYFREQEVRRRSSVRIGDRLGLGFLRALWGYGERPWRPLGWLLLLAGLSAFLLKIALYRDLSLHSAALFSLQSYLVFGYAWLERPSRVVQYIGIAQAFVGTVLMTLFLVALVRRILR